MGKNVDTMAPQASPTQKWDYFLSHYQKNRADYKELGKLVDGFFASRYKTMGPQEKKIQQTVMLRHKALILQSKGNLRTIIAAMIYHYQLSSPKNYARLKSKHKPVAFNAHVGKKVFQNMFKELIAFFKTSSYTQTNKLQTIKRIQKKVMGYLDY